MVLGKSYNDFFEATTSVRSLKELSDQQIDNLFNYLLDLLPNNGKLYKFKSFTSKYFSKNLDSIKKGYIWLPSASTLNDKIDTTFIYKTKRTQEQVKQYYLDNKYKIFKFNIDRSFEYHDRFSKSDLIIFDALAEYGESDKTISIIKEKLKLSYLDSVKYLKTYKKIVKDAILNSMEEAISAFLNLDISMQGDFRIFSMTQDFKQDAMWAYYGDSNNGYCIEYDFKKGLLLNREQKEELLTLYKIKYSDTKCPLDILHIYDIVYKINLNDNDFIKTNQDIFSNLLTKRRAWKHEKEWRIISQKERIYADLVTKIIVDESAIEKNLSKVKRLMRTVNKKEVVIEVRVLDRNSCKFSFVSLKKYERMLGKKIFE